MFSQAAFRSKDYTDPARRHDYNRPAHSVRSDFTTVGAFERRKRVLPDATECEQLSKDHQIYVINFWWPLKPISLHPLNVWNWNTANWSWDWIVRKFIYSSGLVGVAKITDSYGSATIDLGRSWALSSSTATSLMKEE